METFTIKGKVIYKYDNSYKDIHLRNLSNLLINKYGQREINDQKIVKNALLDSLDYYIDVFKKVCIEEKSLSFYQHILFLHDQATELRYKHYHEELQEPIDFRYIAKYRRILKFIIEQTCENNLISREPYTDFLMFRIKDTLNELMYLGEEIFKFLEILAEQDMIEDLATLYFDEQGYCIFNRKHHFNLVFNEIILPKWGASLIKEAYDEKAIEDFKNIIQKAYGIKIDDVSSFIATIHEQNKHKEGDYTGFNWSAFTYNFERFMNVPSNISYSFFKGLTLSRENKHDLSEISRKTYLLDKYLYRPIIIWKVDNIDFAFITKESWTESIIQLTTNAIPWGKAPMEWLKNKAVKKYVHSKEDVHDTWLDNEFEQLLKKHKIVFDRNIKNINGQNILKDPGEIDFIVISISAKTIYLIDCKHLLGRYDFQSQKLDFYNFTESGKKKSYNKQIEKKLKWISKNISLIENHFNLELPDFKLEACFIINTPTLYMLNSKYRIYTIPDFEKVLTGKFKDVEFEFIKDDIKYNITYPYFKKPEFYNNIS